MNKIGEIEIRVLGKAGHSELKPDSYDIKHIAVLLQDVEDLLYPNSKKDRPLITYDIKEGSVKHIFKTSIQAVIGFSAILSQVALNKSVDFLELKTARAIENIQRLSVKKDYEFQIKTSLKEDYELTISPLTKFFRSESLWVEAEFYFYGILKDAGGKTKANIHLDTDDYGYLPIETGEAFLKGQEKNLLYRQYGIRAIGKQNLETGEIDTKSLKLIKLIDYEGQFDEEYLTKLIAKAKHKLKNVNVDEWLDNMRGEYEA